MADTLLARLRNAIDVFRANETVTETTDSGPGTYYRSDKIYRRISNERTIITSIENRIALDVASIDVKHVRLDENGRYLEVINDELNRCLELSANVDQTARAFLFDAVFSMLDTGVIAIVPTYTDVNPARSNSYKIYEMRVGEITQWYPRHVQVRLYNDKTGNKEEIIVRKSDVAIIENPFFAVMNEPNSTMQRLIRKLNLMDVLDDKNSSTKLDMIVQLPYQLKGDLRKEQAEHRRREIEDQLVSSKYGIAYIDAAEHITQLNRPVENNLLNQVQYLTGLLNTQLGLTDDIMNGSANEQTMTNYYNRIIEPIISALVDEMKRKFLTETARSQGQSIKFFRDPFKLVPADKMADIADKYTRNEILSSNEIRQIIGLKPSDDPEADELRNKNLNKQVNDVSQPAPAQEEGIADKQNILKGR